MAVGGFILGLGYALVIGSPSIANLVYGDNSVGGSPPMSVNEAFSLSIWLLWAGFVLLPAGAAVLIYGAAAQKPAPETVSAETGSLSGDAH